MKIDSENWDCVITSKPGWFDIDFKSIWRYRDLLFQFVKRDFVSIYKQTILGPLWIFLQPLFTTIVFTVVFGYIIRVRTGEAPPFLFFMCGVIPWNYFADCLNKTSLTFTANASIFGKVYFPRLISPLSTIISSMIRFLVQFTLFLIVLGYYVIRDGITPWNSHVFFFPFLLILLAGTGLGFGMLVTSATSKYRDLSFVIAFGTQLLLYISPVIYSYENAPAIYRFWLAMNPLTWIFEAFRFAFLGIGIWSWVGLLYSSVIMMFFLILSIIVFNRIEKTFMDTI